MKRTPLILAVAMALALPVAAIAGCRWYTRTQTFDGYWVSDRHASLFYRGVACPPPGIDRSVYELEYGDGLPELSQQLQRLSSHQSPTAIYPFPPAHISFRGRRVLGGRPYWAERGRLLSVEHVLSVADAPECRRR